MTVREALAAAAARLAGRVSDTPRLDAELLMAHALGVEREAMLLRRRDDPAPAVFAALVERRLAPRAGRLYHRPPRLLDDRARGRPGRARSPARQRDPDRGGGRPFRRRGARRGSSISAPAPARCCSPRSTNGRRRPASASTPRRRRSAYARRNATRPRRIPARRLGRGDRRAIRPDPVQPALCRGAAPTCPPTSPRSSRTAALFAGGDGLDAYRAPRAAIRPPARARRHRLPRDRRRPGDGRRRADGGGGLHDQVTKGP